MDFASALSLQECMTLNNARMDQQEEHLMATGRAVQALVTQVSELTSQLQQLRSPAASPLPLIPPQPTNAEHNFSLQPRTFATESSRVALVLTLLSGRAAFWGAAVWENQHPCCSSFQALSKEIKRVFDRTVVGREAARMLADLHQGSMTVSDYSIEFRTLAAECKWNEEAQWDMFLHELADRIQTE
ncbi:Retrotransposon-derived protein PEG10 [Labeo rohita]|uniref:Retrotransposon-derived protein PEG10 n=1 Tax=Labeo rohita TaxID=84645 RepID=A0ABQ8LH70_LABRO|nr:Retrotransposon-derived protein PEG10 [Labeo rohita]